MAMLNHQMVNIRNHTLGMVKKKSVDKRGNPPHLITMFFSFFLNYGCSSAAQNSRKSGDRSSKSWRDKQPDIGNHIVGLNFSGFTG